MNSIEQFGGAEIVNEAYGGIEEYIEFLKQDISAGLNIPIEQLTPEVMNPRGLERLARYAEFTPNSRIISHDMWALRQGFESFAVYEDQEGERIHSGLIGIYIFNASQIIINIIGNRIERRNLEVVERMCYTIVNRFISGNRGYRPHTFLHVSEREVLRAMNINTFVSFPEAPHTDAVDAMGNAMGVYVKTIRSAAEALREQQFQPHAILSDLIIPTQEEVRNYLELMGQMKANKTFIIGKAAEEATIYNAHVGDHMWLVKNPMLTIVKGDL